MSIKFHSSILFDKPHLTITHLNIDQHLYQHKKKLLINCRSISTNNNYKTQKLSLNQAKTLQNLSSRVKNYSMNTILNSFNKNHQINKIQNSKIKNIFTINTDSLPICPQKIKSFRNGVHYKSLQRSKGCGVNKIDPESLKDYFYRSSQEQQQKLTFDNKTQITKTYSQIKKRPNTTRVQFRNGTKSYMSTIN